MEMDFTFLIVCITFFISISFSSDTLGMKK